MDGKHVTKHSSASAALNCFQAFLTTTLHFYANLAVELSFLPTSLESVEAHEKATATSSTSTLTDMSK